MRFIENRLRNDEMTGMHHGNLHIITNSSGDIFQRDVEKEFNIPRSTATGMLQLMEKNGFIQREPVPHDARLKKIIITEKGNKMVASAAQSIAEIESIITKGISEDELEAFFSVLDRMVENDS